MIYDPTNTYMLGTGTVHMDFIDNGTDYLVDATGYVAKERLISSFAQAGIDLDAYNRTQYPNDYGSNSNEEPEYDPTTSYGYDIFDAHADLALARQYLDDEQRRQNTGLDQAVGVTTLLGTGTIR